MSDLIRPSLRPLKAWLSDVVGGSAHGTKFRSGFELELRFGDNLVGLGEASPLPNFSTETLEEVEPELANIHPLQTTLPQTPAECRPWVEELVHRVNCRVASARLAFEGALVDLCSRNLAIPCAELIAQLGTTKATTRAELPVSKLLTGTEPTSLLVQARHAWARGYRTLKVKLGPLEDFDRQFDTLVALRQGLDSTMRLRLDPNQSWPAQTLARLLARLQSLSPELVEDPVVGSELLSCEASPIPLALDESLLADGLLAQLAPHIARLNIRAVVIKPALHGLLRSVDLAEQAEHLGLDVIITHLFDGPIGHATAVSLALALGTPSRAHGLAPHPGLLLSPHRRVLGLGGGQLRLVPQPGLPVIEVAHS
jgi:o-succinylbenzoate synthase